MLVASRVRRTRCGRRSWDMCRATPPTPRATLRSAAGGAPSRLSIPCRSESVTRGPATLPAYVRAAASYGRAVAGAGRGTTSAATTRRRPSPSLRPQPGRCRPAATAFPRGFRRVTLSVIELLACPQSPASERGRTVRPLPPMVRWGDGGSQCPCARLHLDERQTPGRRREVDWAPLPVQTTAKARGSAAPGTGGRAGARRRPSLGSVIAEPPGASADQAAWRPDSCD
jgi:hypothetical protein